MCWSPTVHGILSHGVRVVVKTLWEAQFGTLKDLDGIGVILSFSHRLVYKEGF